MAWKCWEYRVSSSGIDPTPVRAWVSESDVSNQSGNTSLYWVCVLEGSENPVITQPTPGVQNVFINTPALDLSSKYMISVREKREVAGETHVSQWSGIINNGAGLVTPDTAPSGSKILQGIQNIVLGSRGAPVDEPSPNNTSTSTASASGSISTTLMHPDAAKVNLSTGVSSGTFENSGIIINEYGILGFKSGTGSNKSSDYKKFFLDASTGDAYFAGEVTAGNVVIGPDAGPQGQDGIYINDTNYWYGDGTFKVDGKDLASAILGPGGNGGTPGSPTNPGPLSAPTGVTNLNATWTGEELTLTFDYDRSQSGNIYAKTFKIIFVAGGSTKEIVIPISSGTSHSYTLTLQQNKALFGIAQSGFTAISVTVIDAFGIESSPTSLATIPTLDNGLSDPWAGSGLTVTSIVNGYTVHISPLPTGAGISIEEVETESLTDPGSGYNVVYQGYNINPVSVITPNLNPRWVKVKLFKELGDTSPYSTSYRVVPQSPVSIDNTPPNEVDSVSAAWSGDDIQITYALPAIDPAVRVQVQLTAVSNGAVGYFYFFPVEGQINQTARIFKRDLYNQFGDYYSSFNGVLKSIDSSDNRSAGVSFATGARDNPLAGIVPTFELQALTNGYSVSWVQPVGSTYADVYELKVPWTADPIDESDRVYAGPSPAYIITSDYDDRYIKIRFYDDFGNTSEYSSHSPQRTVVPIDPAALSIINNPVTFSTEGSILAGSSATTGARAIFNKDGFFIYDDTESAPSTQIVGNASNGMPTFITEQAKIANWTITSSKIENLDFASTGTYTGLSSSGTYAFWAGSDVAGGDSSAKFSVKPDGSVTARQISIIGNGTNSELINAGGLFIVKNDGSLTATSATVTGTINASSGSFTGKLSIGTNGAIYSGTLSGDNLVGQGFAISKSGLQFNSATVAGITTINGDTGLFTTSSALIGGWTIDSTSIKKQGASGTVSMVSGENPYIAAQGSYNSLTYYSGLSAPASATDIVIWAGQAGLKSTSNNFYVRADGFLKATAAEISGKVTATQGTIGGWTIGDTSLYAGTSTGLVTLTSSASSSSISFGTQGGQNQFAKMQMGVSTSGNSGSLNIESWFGTSGSPAARVSIWNATGPDFINRGGIDIDSNWLYLNSATIKVNNISTISPSSVSLIGINDDKTIVNTGIHLWYSTNYGASAPPNTLGSDGDILFSV